MSVQRWLMAVGCVVGAWAVGCQSEADEAAARDAEGVDDVGASDASADDGAVVDAFVCSCTDPVDGVCTVDPRNADDGWVLDTIPDGTECRRREGPFFCNNGCGSPGTGQLWFDEQAQRYVHFFAWPCVTDGQRDHWRLVQVDNDTEPGEYTAVSQRFEAAPDCPFD